MPASLSKVAGSVGFRVLPHNCYELAHTWNPSCVGATLDVTKSAALYSLKVYTALYTVTMYTLSNLCHTGSYSALHSSGTAVVLKLVAEGGHGLPMGKILVWGGKS